ncbi:MAG TPA: hypothetical protein VFV68_12875 [Agriterribacter sp.]|nr:hypothetical protein [Agriterribacter sp.]
MMYEKEIITALQNELAIPLPDTFSWDTVQLLVKEKVEEMLQHDFQGLITLLYRIDVNENKLKEMLEARKGADAADTISTLIIERQLQKAKSRKEPGTDDQHFSEEEKW